MNNTLAIGLVWLILVGIGYVVLKHVDAISFGTLPGFH